MAGVSLALLLAGKTEFALGHQLEHMTAFPLSWAFAAAAVVQLLVAELGHHAEVVARRAQEHAEQRTVAPAPAAMPQVVHFPILR